MKNDLLQKIKERLRSLYGDRLKGVILYGSEARGDAAPDSDIDILVLLEGPVAVWKEITATINATFDLQDDAVNRPIAIIPVDAAGYESGACGFYSEVQREGILL